MNHPPLSSLPGTSSASSTMSSGARSKVSVKANLLSHATATAVVAAKSILLSGGSEEVALKTARAAAASVLNPSNSGDESVAGRSLGFFGRRKVRRQAAVVASMALVTASNSIQNGLASDWSASDSTPGSHMNPYTRNITTRPMSATDEPSVLSGTTKPPRPPLGPFALSQRLSNKSLDENSGISFSKSSPIIPMEKLGDQENKSETANKVDTTPSENVSPIIVPLKNPAQSVLNDPTNSNMPISGSKASEPENVGALITVGKQDSLFDDETTLDPASVWSSARKTAGWQDFDPLFNTVTSMVGLLTCGPVGVSTGSRKIKANGIPQRIAHRHRDFETVASAIDTLDERTDAGTEFPSLDSYDDTHQTKDHTVSTSSSGESSIGSSYIHEAHSCSAASEADITVRNSLRNTMEKVVSKSRNEYEDILDDPKWQTYDIGDRSSRGERSVGIPAPPTSKRGSAHARSLRVTRVTPKNRKRGFFVGK